MLGVIPIIFALILLDLLPVAAEDGPGALTSALVIGLSLVVWCGLQLLVGRWLRRSGPRAVIAWEAASATGALLIHAAWIAFFDLTGLIPSRFLAVLPFVLLLVAGWYSTARARLSAPEARGAVNNRVRFAALPVLIAIASLDLLTGLLLLLGVDLLALEREASLWAAVISLGFIFLILTCLPIMVAFIWRTRPMPAGPERELIEWGCRRMGVRYRRCHVWPAASGRFYNAAVLGLVPQTRFLLFSEDLLRALTPDQLKAVLGHELGHIRHHHIWFYLLFLMAGFAVAQLIAVGLTPLLTPLVGDRDLANVLGLIVVLVLLLRGGFGMLSRACERQADLAGAELAGSTEPMQEALATVARLSGQPVHAPSWMHGSIAERIAYLKRVRHDPGLRSWHHRGVMKLRFFILLMLGMVIIWQMNQVARHRDMPADYLFAEPERKAVAESAIGGDSTPLYNHLLSMQPAARAPIASAILSHLEAMQDEHGIGRVYEQRYLLWPFRRLSTDSEQLDHRLENYLAYVLVAGTTAPLPEEVGIAAGLEPSLRDYAESIQADASWSAANLFDTTGCILFVQGDRTGAKTDFIKAQGLLPGDDEDLTEEGRQMLADFRGLLRERIAACENGDAALPLEEHPYQPGTLPAESQTHADPSPDDGSLPPAAEAAPNEAGGPAGEGVDAEPATDVEP